MGSVSKTDITVSGKKLKNSDTVERITLSPARNPSLFLKKNTLLILLPIKEGFGADIKSPTTRSPHLGNVKSVPDIVYVSPSTLANLKLPSA